MRKRTSFVCAYALLVALGVPGCGGGVEPGMPKDVAPSAEQLKQDAEVGALNAGSLNPSTKPVTKK
jgi:hypothetical protein